MSALWHSLERLPGRWKSFSFVFSPHSTTRWRNTTGWLQRCSLGCWKELQEQELQFSGNSENSTTKNIILDNCTPKYKTPEPTSANFHPIALQCFSGNRQCPCQHSFWGISSSISSLSYSLLLSSSLEFWSLERMMLTNHQERRTLIILINGSSITHRSIDMLIFEGACDSWGGSSVLGCQVHLQVMSLSFPLKDFN